MTGMTKGERDDLIRLIKQRERLAKTAAEQRSAALLADFEGQISREHHWDTDETWKAAYKAGEAAFQEANRAVHRRCDELGIPQEFRPQIAAHWSVRGETALTVRREELRKVAKAEIAAIEAQARTMIESESVKAQAEILSHGLTSEAAIEFLRTLPSVESLMPPINLKAIEDRVGGGRKVQRGLTLYTREDE